MRKIGLLKNQLLFFCFLSFGITAQASSIKVPLEIYGQLPSLEDVELSPDGTKIAFVKSDEEDRIAYIMTLSDKRILSGCDVGRVKLRDLIWTDNDNILFMTSITGTPTRLIGPPSENLLLHSYNITTGKDFNPLRKPTEGSWLNVIIGQPMIRKIDGDTVMFVEGIYVKRYTMPALFKVNLKTRDSEMLIQGTEISNGWLVDENGLVVADQTYNEKTLQWSINIWKEGEIVEITSGDIRTEYPTIEGFSPSGDEVWVSSVENHDPTWKSISLKNGMISEPLQEVKGFRNMITDPYTNRIIGGYLMNVNSDFVFLDQHLQGVWEKLKNFLTGEYVDFISASSDYQKMVVLVDGPKHGYAYFLYDIVENKLHLIGNVYDNLKQIAEVRAIEYIAEDGMKIPGFLTLPPGREIKDLPLVVLPHGGPASHDTGRFDWWAQALASQGYAVLQPNYRGSDLNWEFISAGFGEWGRKMQTDLSDGVRHLVKDGIVDGNRVCIVGASYGGYAALAGATLDQGVYRCAVSVSGLSDLSKYLKWIADKKQDTNNLERSYWELFYGASSPDDPILKTISPLEHAKNVTIPILLVHGRDDTVVPFEQSQLMVKALKREDKLVEFVKLKKEDHWLSRSETRLQMLQATVDFLIKHNPPD